MCVDAYVDSCVFVHINGSKYYTDVRMLYAVYYYRNTTS